jgi:two-component system, chemotaxis family, sensor kinase CheA
MDDLLREFLTETGESLDLPDLELVRFEQEPNNIKILENIFRLVHTIKGTCGFLGLPRLEALTHAAETLMSGFRGGRRVTTDAVSLILATIDRIKALLDELERHQAEPQGNDRDLIAQLQGAASGDVAAAGPTEAAASARSMTSALAPSPQASGSSYAPVRPHLPLPLATCAMTKQSTSHRKGAARRPHPMRAQASRQPPTRTLSAQPRTARTAKLQAARSGCTSTRSTIS